MAAEAGEAIARECRWPAEIVLTPDLLR
jgi:hypothetical protein